MKRYDPTPPWETYEVILREADGTLSEGGVRPFSQKLADHGDPITTALGKMWLVGFHGWHKARLHLVDHIGKPLIVRADSKEPEIWILKCKPSCWRLYFHVYQDSKRIVYLYAKCKKKNAQDAADAARARTVLNGLRPGGSGIIAFEFPAP